MSRFVMVAKTGDLKPGDGRSVEVEGKTYALFNIEGTYRCLDNTCLHRGGPLGEGFVDGRNVTCPWHGWQYDSGTGACVANPAATVAVHEVRVEGEDILIAI